MPDGNKIVSVPGVGNISFPGTMDDAAINQAIGQHLAAMQPGAMQSRKGGPIFNAQATTPPAPEESDNTKRARGAAIGLAEGVGIQPSTSPVQVIKQTLSNFGSSVGGMAKKGYNEWQGGMQRELPTSMQGGLSNLVTAPLAVGMTPIDMLAQIIENSATGLENTGKNAAQAVQNKDTEGLWQSLGSGAGQLAMLKAGGKAGEDPVGVKGFQNTAREIINEGPSKARVLADQHAHALELQKHVASVADAVHQDAQQAMAQVSQAVDSAKPEGAFDKAEVRGRVSAAMGDTLEDQSQLPTSLKKLTTPEKPSMANFVNKNTADFVNRLKQGGMAPDEIAQALKEQGFQPTEIKAALGDTGTTQPGRMTFEEVKQARSDLGRQMGRLQGPAQAAASAAYGELSKVLREGARDASQEPQWIDANAKWKGYLDDFHRSPIAKTLAGENASDIMEPLTGKSRVQTLDILSKYEPFGIDMEKINQEVGRSGAIDTVQRLSRPTKMDLLIAKLSPTSAGLRAGVPRMLRNPAAADFLGGKGFEPENISPKKVYPNKAAAAADLKGNSTPFGGPPEARNFRGSERPARAGQNASDAMMRNEVLKESLADAQKKLQGAKGAERGIIERQIADFKDMLGET